MSRIARKYLGTSFFHVMVQGIQKEYIFNQEKYIKKYLELLKQYTKESDIEIVAYCIMSNHAHMILYTENTDAMSKAMQKINTSYAQYYNKVKEGRVGYVFRNRFKSEPITNKRYLLQCIKYIHQNPVKANIVTKSEDYQFSSYNEYKNSEKKFKHTEIKDQITQEDYQIICENENCTNIFIDVDINQSEIIKDAITEYIKMQEKDLVEIFINRKFLKKLIQYLKKEKGIKYTEIMKELEITQGIMTELKK